MQLTCPAATHQAQKRLTLTDTSAPASRSSDTLGASFSEQAISRSTSTGAMPPAGRQCQHQTDWDCLALALLRTQSGLLSLHIGSLNLLVVEAPWSAVIISHP